MLLKDYLNKRTLCDCSTSLQSKVLILLKRKYKNWKKKSFLNKNPLYILITSLRNTTLCFFHIFKALSPKCDIWVCGQASASFFPVRCTGKRQQAVFSGDWRKLLANFQGLSSPSCQRGCLHTTQASYQCCFLGSQILFFLAHSF